MTRQVINIGSTANDGTGDTLRAGAAKINTNFQEIYQTFGPDGFVIGQNVSFDSASINFSDPTFSFETNVGAVGPTANRFIKFPDYTGTVLLDSASQTIINKTLDSCSFGALLINDLSSTHQYKVLSSELSSNIDVTLPVLNSDDTFVFATASQTVTNKSLDSCTINGAVITDTILTDNSGDNLLQLLPITGTGVNYLKLRNSVTNSPVDISVDGSDTDVSVRLLPKGSGAIELSGNVIFGDGQQADLTTNGGTLLADQPALFIDASGSDTWTLPDGDEKGEVVYLTNVSSTQAITIEPTNFFQGTNFALAVGEVAHLIWNGASLHVVNKSDVSIT